MTIEEMLNKPFVVENKRDRECWSFCKKVWRLMDKPVPKSVRQLKRVDGPELGDIVLFDMKDGSTWHMGVVWPNPLFFIHARPPLDRHAQDGPFVVEQRSLTDAVFSMFIDGYFR